MWNSPIICSISSFSLASEVVLGAAYADNADHKKNSEKYSPLENSLFSHFFEFLLIDIFFVKHYSDLHFVSACCKKLIFFIRIFGIQFRAGVIIEGHGIIKF